MGHVHRRASQDRRLGRERDEVARDHPDPGPALQRAAGNRAVTALIGQAQTKLTVGAPDDPLEHEADAIAEQVAAAVRTGVPAGTTDVPGRSIRRSGGGTDGGQASDDVETSLGSAGGGRPLPAGTRDRMESAFGADFSEVRVHTGSGSAALNDQLSAQAFTVGSDIYFRDRVPDATDPLLAHELTHVIQQGGGGGTVARRKEVERKKGTPETTRKTETEDGTTTSTKETKAQVGVKVSSESSSDVFDGTTHRTSESEHEVFAGAETAVKTISKASATEIEHAVEVMARAGVFGESSRKAAISRGPAKASAEGSISGKAGVESTAKASVTVRPDLFNALSLVMSAAAQAGVETTMEGKLEAALGPLAGSISGKLHAFAGAMASVGGKLDVGVTHITAEIEAKIFAGAKAEAEGEVSVKLGGAEAKAVGEATAMAGAEAEAKGQLKIDLSGIEVSGKAEAFAGVKAEAKGTASFAYKGRPILSASGSVSASAGIGGTAEGTFVCRKGKVKISGELAATLGIGTGLSVDVEVDLYALAYMIQDLIVTAFLQKKEEINRGAPYERVPIIEQHLQAKKRQEGYNTYLQDFRAYDAKKAKQGKSGIKRERIQEILDKRWHANKENWKFVEFDEGIVLAARDVFGSKLIDFIVQQGQIRAFRVQRTAEQEAHIKKQRMKKGSWF